MGSVLQVCSQRCQNWACRYPGRPMKPNPCEHCGELLSQPTAGTGGVLAAVPDAGQPADAGGSPGRGVRAGVLAGPVSAEDVRRGTSSLTSGKFREMLGGSPSWRFSPVKPALNRCNEKRKGPRKTRLGSRRGGALGTSNAAAAGTGAQGFTAAGQVFFAVFFASRRFR